jgi:RimJ/RimL family protein N-acetyltransferase
MDVEFRKLTQPTAEIVEILNRWENDPRLIHLTRWNKDQDSLDKRITMTIQDLEEQLLRKQIYLIYARDQLVGEVDFQIDPVHLYKKDIHTAWIGLMIGEEFARGKGIGYLALQYVEKEIHAHGLQRIELGVFEFNTNAIKLYERTGYQEIGRIPNFTFWEGKLWDDIRMEKFIER